MTNQSLAFATKATLPEPLPLRPTGILLNISTRSISASAPSAISTAPISRLRSTFSTRTNMCPSRPRPCNRSGLSLAPGSAGARCTRARRWIQSVRCSLNSSSASRSLTIFFLSGRPESTSAEAACPIRCTYTACYNHAKTAYSCCRCGRWVGSSFSDRVRARSERVGARHHGENQRRLGAARGIPADDTRSPRLGSRRCRRVCERNEEDRAARSGEEVLCDGVRVTLEQGAVECRCNLISDCTQRCV